MITVMYGASPDPYHEPNSPPFVPVESDRFGRLARMVDPTAPHRVRICVLVEDGKTKLRVLVDGKLVSDIEAMGSITIETDV